MMMLITVLVVSGALLAGAAWGVYGRLRPHTEGFLVALAGGALMISAVDELIAPAREQAPLFGVIGMVFAGAIVFTALDYAVDEIWGQESGGGLLTAITLDGVPENLALGVALIGAGPMAVAALAGSILLSNLPEAAGGARGMLKTGHSRAKVFGLWAATALLLSAAAVIGNLMLRDAPDGVLALIRAFAAGAVLASLALEVFPQAFREDHYWAGAAVALGVSLALWLGSLGG